MCSASSCGRHYHYTVRCCDNNHTLALGPEKKMGYIVKGGEIFLDKCGAFTALGRNYIIRISDYRKCDKVLTDQGLAVSDHYLFEKWESARGKRRRSHISLRAFTLLVKEGFVHPARKKELMEALDNIGGDVEKQLKEDCPNINAADSSEKVEFKAEIESCDAPEFHENILGQKTKCRVEHGKVYLLLDAVSGFICEDDRPIKTLKRKARAHGLEVPFFPGYFKEGSERFVSAECLLTLTEKGSSSLEPERQQMLVSQLKILVEQQSDLNTETGTEEDDPGSELDINDEDGNVERPVVQILDASVPYQVSNGSLYLDKKISFDFLTHGPRNRMLKSVDTLLEKENVCLDEAFLFLGRRRAFISVQALKVLCEHRAYLKEKAKKKALLARLDELDRMKDSLKVADSLELKSAARNVGFKFRKGTVYLNTVHLLKAIGYNAVSVDYNTSKIYFVLCKMLNQLGLNLDTCFLKQGKSKYGFISLHSVWLLFQTGSGPFRNKAKNKLIYAEILDALNKLGIHETRQQPKTVDQDEHQAKLLKLTSEFPYLRYQIKEGAVFVDRQISFECFGLDKVIVTCSRGYGPINEILMRSGLKVSDCYLEGPSEKFAYISLLALIRLLEANDPLLNCLETREKFMQAVMLALQSGVVSVGEELVAVNEERCIKLGESVEIPFRTFGGRIFLSRAHSYSAADFDGSPVEDSYLRACGFVPEDCFLPDGEEFRGYIAADALILMIGCILKNEPQKVPSTDLLRAILSETPKLRAKIKISNLRSQLLDLLLDTLARHLEPQEGAQNSDIFVVKGQVEKPLYSSRRRKSSSGSCRTSSGGSNNSTTNEAEDLNANEQRRLVRDEDDPGHPLELKHFLSASEQVQASKDKGTVGNWEIKKADNESIELQVAAAKKMSYINPDVSAVVNYRFSIGAKSAPKFLINGLPVNGIKDDIFLKPYVTFVVFRDSRFRDLL